MDSHFEDTSGETDIECQILELQEIYPVVHSLKQSMEDLVQYLGNQNLKVEDKKKKIEVDKAKFLKELEDLRNKVKQVLKIDVKLNERIKIINDHKSDEVLQFYTDLLHKKEENLHTKYFSDYEFFFSLNEFPGLKEIRDNWKINRTTKLIWHFMQLKDELAFYQNKPARGQTEDYALPITFYKNWCYDELPQIFYISIIWQDLFCITLSFRKKDDERKTIEYLSLTCSLAFRKRKMKMKRSLPFITEIEQQYSEEQTRREREKIRKIIANNFENLDLPCLQPQNQFFQTLTLKSQSSIEERFHPSMPNLRSYFWKTLLGHIRSRYMTLVTTQSGSTAFLNEMPLSLRISIEKPDE